MSDDLNQILNQAIPAWARLTNTRLGTNTFRYAIDSDSQFQERDLKQYVDDLNQARTLDMSGTTAILLLRGLFDAYVRERALKVHAILFEPQRVEASLHALRALHAQITGPACEDAVATFREAIRMAAVHYGYDLDRLRDHLADERALGDLRMAAARSLEDLTVHQFVQGTPDPRPLQYNREIFQFANINALVTALRAQRISGITLALVRDAGARRGDFGAFFALGFRNGQSITVLTDHEEGVHPDHHLMTRRPERQLDERARRHWFPYRLLDLDSVEPARDANARGDVDAQIAPIDRVAALEPPEFIWLALLFDLVARRYGGAFRAEEISYTGAMVVDPHALVESTHALVASGQYAPLVLPRLTPETATREAADTHPPVGHNAWMEDRYRDRVPAILLDVVGQRRALEVGRQASRLLPGDVDRTQLPERRRERNALIVMRGQDRREAELAPRALDPASFGTRRQIARNRAWAARVNMMQAVQRLAVAEFVEKRDLVMRWYRARVARNMPMIWRAVASGELTAPVMRWRSDDPQTPFPSHDAQVWSQGNILQQETAQRPRPGFHGRGIEIGGYDPGRRHVTCGVAPPARASVFTLIEPDNPRALAILCGISERKMPWMLRHWWTNEPYTGNSILDRIDPQDELDDPWRHLDLAITVALCRRALTRLRREHGVLASPVQQPDRTND